jgi:hypothetical protein
MRQGFRDFLCDGYPMADKKLRSTFLKAEEEKLRFTPLKPEDELFLTRPQLCTRWSGCSEKALIRVEKRFDLTAYRILRGIRYKLSDVLRVEAEGALRMPKRFVGLRPHEKAELRRREREELST